MSLPKITILISNGNLLQDISALDGIAGIVGTVNTVGLVGVPKVVHSLQEAIDAGYTEDAEAFLYRMIKEFYDEVAGNQELHVMGLSDATTMASALDKTNAAGAIKLVNASEGRVRLLGVCRKPAAGYNAGADFFDADVQASVLAGKAFVDDQNARLNFLRVLVEGRVTTEGSGTIYQPKTSSAGNVGVVVGGSANDGSASVGTALGRAVKYAAHIKIGKVANGPLALNTVYIGTKLLKDYAGLEALHGGGCISFMQHPQKAGYYFGIDRMASTDDYRLLAYGRVVDKAAIIAIATYVEELESEVDVDANGNISELDCKHLEGRLEQAINANMGNQISGVEVYINPAQNIINTSKLAVKLRVRPKGYTSFIDIDLGLNAPTA